MFRQKNRGVDRRVVFIIFNSIPPYMYETNNILALPNGMPYRARFREEWHPEITNPSQIENRDGIIILRDWATAKLIPLRRIRTAKVDPVGDTYYINYLLVDLIEYDSDSSTRLHQVQEFNEKITLELRPYINESAKDLKKLVFLGPDLAANISDSNPKGDISQREYDNWGRIVGILGTLDCFLDIDFLKVIGFANEKGISCSLGDVEGSKRYLLTNSSVYALEIFQRSHVQKSGDSSVSTRKIVMEGEHDAIRHIRDRFAILGKYDQFKFRFRTQVLQRSRDTDIAVDIQRSDDKGPIPTIYIPIRVTTSLWTLLYQSLALLVFLSGTGILLFADKLFPQNVGLAQSISIFLMILTSVETREFVKSLLERLGSGFLNR